MSLFLLSFFLIYGSLHAYVFFKAKEAMAFGNAMAAMMVVFFVIMVISPVLVRVTELHGMHPTASVIAHISYTWMGFLFLFFSASIAVKLYNLLLIVAGKLFDRGFSDFALQAVPGFYLPLLIAAVISMYGFFEARHIKAERITITSPKMPVAVKKLVVVQISDLHLGVMVGKDRLTKVLELVKAEDPDMVVSTGDLLDSQLDGLGVMVPLLQELKPPLGKFAVTGNHEVYAGLQQALSFMEKADFKILRHETAAVAGLLDLVGVDDPASLRDSRKKAPAETDLLAGLSRNRFTLLLKHRPVIEPASLGLFDLQLSGHVHKGQIFPFNLLTHLFYPVKMGLSRHPNNSSLYVSRGTGTWGPPIRFLAPPEITVITIIPAR
ncbi:metallophosphoesterase [Geotalea daltonii FRC-32]|uniref:Metallophosphoesterase n=1 Tax=Geotalea daltonii (strain DSM 22248 / JCM 15807 / FRC-32) TaxID=316067 RepID=B9M8U2_GEODF|nr:metallophosphoesterase [Geotalea daltonii]ACM20438.1 metallophosphoesterase [Geotalea daltonii FRC-32]